jgi:hypothetical protein
MLVCAIVQFLAHETAGAARTRHSLRPLFEEAQSNLEKLGQNMPREREAMTDIVSRALRSMERSGMMRCRPGTQESAAGMGPDSRPGHERRGDGWR